MYDLLLSVKNLEVFFKIPSKKHLFDFKHDTLKAVHDISFDLLKGKTLGIVGESGCGKSTLARALIGLVPVHSGSIFYEDKDLLSMNIKQQRMMRKKIQMIFQDPLASLDPRMTIGDSIAEPLKAFYPNMSKRDRKKIVLSTMDRVGMLANVINRYPHEFSGGQCQRIGIARALVIKPELIICDEPVSALDVSIQAQIINLLKSLQKENNLSLIFISHDLSVVKHISDDILIMYLGNFAEIADTNEFFLHPLHPYNKALVSAVPIANPRLEREKKTQLLYGDLPSPINPPSGCVFRTRCPNVIDICSKEKPIIEIVNKSHAVSCFNHVK